MNRKFFKTTYTVVVLSEETPASDMSLEDLSYEIDTGPCVGVVSDDDGVELTQAEMSLALNEAGSCPDFFSIGDEVEVPDELS